MCTRAHPYGRVGRCGFGGRGVTADYNFLWLIIYSIRYVIFSKSLDVMYYYVVPLLSFFFVAIFLSHHLPYASIFTYYTELMQFNYYYVNMLILILN
jgi:hypothetical protein